MSVVAGLGLGAPGRRAGAGSLCRPAREKVTGRPALPAADRAAGTCGNRPALREGSLPTRGDGGGRAIGRSVGREDCQGERSRLRTRGDRLPSSCR